MGFIDDPGGLVVSVALLRPKLMVFLPVPPDRATISPVYWSIMTMPLCSCESVPL